MGIALDRLEQRIIGVLIEKQLTVPDTYPLTQNALISGCNQKNNRDPQITVEDYEMEGALRALMDRAWVLRVERDTGRSHRYSHQASQQLGVEVADLAILSELLCRGPQAPGALKTRCGRMHTFASPGDVEAHLREMAARPAPYVRELPRRPREQGDRWCHLFDDGAEGERLHAEATGTAPPPAESARPASDAVAAAPPSATAATTPAQPESRDNPGERVALDNPRERVALDELRERVAQLEDEVSELRARLDRLQG